MRAAKERGDKAEVERLALKRRQEMPEEAFISASELEEGGKYINRFSDLGRIAIFAASYCWETSEHPDPEGNTMVMLADAVEECYRKKAEYEQAEGLVDYSDFPDEFGLFLDYSCLFQHPPGGRRAEEEEALFKEALDDMELWYAHTHTTVFLLTKSGTGERYYHKRGWPAYESLVARILKVRHDGVWDPVIDVGKPESKSQQQPPPSAAAFKAKLASGKLTFSNGSDVELVGGLYEKTLRNAYACLAAASVKAAAAAEKAASEKQAAAEKAASEKQAAAEKAVIQSIVKACFSAAEEKAAAEKAAKAAAERAEKQKAAAERKEPMSGFWANWGVY